MVDNFDLENVLVLSVMPTMKLTKKHVKEHVAKIFYVFSVLNLLFLTHLVILLKYIIVLIFVFNLSLS